MVRMGADPETGSFVILPAFLGGALMLFAPQGRQGTVIQNASAMDDLTTDGCRIDYAYRDGSPVNVEGYLLTMKFDRQSKIQLYCGYNGTHLAYRLFNWSTSIWSSWKEFNTTDIV